MNEEYKIEKASKKKYGVVKKKNSCPILLPEVMCPGDDKKDFLFKGTFADCEAWIRYKKTKKI